MPSIDVVVPTYRRWDLTERCLDQLTAQTVPRTVVVSDDGSGDDTPARVRARFPDAVVVESDRNRGFAAACNAGVAAGSSEYVVLLNNDVLVRPDFLQRLVEPLAADPQVAAVAPLLLKVDEHTIDSVGLAVDPTLAGFPRHAGRPMSEAASERPVLVGPSGGAAAYRRTAWDEAGGLDEAIFFYSEDLDLALRLRATGWRAAAAPDSIAVHLGSQTIGERSRRSRYNAGFARAYLLRRFRVLRTRAAAHALAAELLVALGDAALSRDLAAARGRMAGWRAADGLPPKPRPPGEAVDDTIRLIESLRLRWGDVGAGQRPSTRS